MLKNFVRSMILLGALALCCPLTAQQTAILLKDGGRPIPLNKVISKDQFGVIVPAKVNPENGDVLRKFIPFVDMNPASLSLFPFVDTKSAERIYNAVQDRQKLIAKKFAKRTEAYNGTQDYTKNLLIHTGVDEYYIFFHALESTDTGMVGFIYSEAPDSLFYGKIFLYALLGKPGDVWIGPIHPTDQTITVNGSTYKVFTAIPPVRKSFLEKQQENEKKKQGRRGPRGNRRGPGRGQHNGPPPGQ